MLSAGQDEGHPAGQDEGYPVWACGGRARSGQDIPCRAKCKHKSTIYADLTAILQCLDVQRSPNTCKATDLRNSLQVSYLGGILSSCEYQEPWK